MPPTTAAPLLGNGTFGRDMGRNRISKAPRRRAPIARSAPARKASEKDPLRLTIPSVLAAGDPNSASSRAYSRPDLHAGRESLPGPHQGMPAPRGIFSGLSEVSPSLGPLTACQRDHLGAFDEIHPRPGEDSFRLP